jgi:hypothetical protein
MMFIVAIHFNIEIAPGRITKRFKEMKKHFL